MEIEKQNENKIKVLRSDRGGEDYERYTKKGKIPSPFAMFLKDEGNMHNIQCQTQGYETV